jgi:putative flippase GtrA
VADRGRAGLPAAVVGLMRRSRFLRFLLAGAINTLFGYVVYTASIIAGVPVPGSLLIGMLAGTVFNFFTTGGYAFRQLRLGRYPAFVACYVLVYGMNLALFRLVAMWVDSALAVQALLLVPLALLSYFLMARFVFTRDE